VTKSNVTSFTATVELSADPDLVKTVVADSEVITVDVLLPGTLLNASISKVTGTKYWSILLCHFMNSGL
jgi:hypothetical protein